MSVKITRHETKRNTSLRDFILVATLPLLLFGAIGYLVGSNRSGDAEKNAAELAKVRAKFEKLNRESIALNAYLTEADSLRTSLKDDLKALNKERMVAFSAEPTALGDDPIAEWWKQTTAVQRDYQRKMKRLEGLMEGDKILSRKQIAIPMDLFTDFNEKAYENFDTYKDARERYGMNRNKFASSVEDLEIEHREAISELKSKLSRANEKVDDLSNEKDKLIEQLSNTGKVICPDNSEEKSAIKDGVTEIVAVVEGLAAKRGFLNLNKETREDIRQVQIEVKKIGEKIRDNASEVQ